MGQAGRLARFAPPQVGIPAYLEWVIRRALGAPDTAVGLEVDPQQTLATADLLLLTPRIARRTSRELLRQELGDPVAGCFELELRNATAVQMQYLGTCRLVADVAGELAVPVIFLKGMALQLAGLVPVGDRPVADVDILVPTNAAGRLQAALVDRGFRHRTRVSTRHPHHLPPLWSPQWLGLEVHDLAAGLSVTAGATSATAEELLGAAVCVRLADLPGSAFVPRLDLLVGHLVAHSLAHHPTNPAHFFRLLVDLQSVLEHGADADELADQASRWVSPLVGREEVEAVFSLARAGSARDVVDQSSVAAGLLRHFAAVVVDPPYRRRMAASSFLLRDDPADLSRGRSRLPRLLWRRSDVLGPAGQPLSWPRYLVWSTARPFGFALRLIRAALPR